MKCTTNSKEETQKIAQKLAKKYRNGAILALIGPLGSGKTTFTQGFAKGLGISDKLISPTFVLMRQYQIPDTNSKLIHIDLYRLEEINQIEQLGLQEIFTNPNNIILIEWADRLGKSLPAKSISIEFKILGDQKREIYIKE